MSDRTVPLRIRQSARAVIVTPDHHVLLVRFEFADGTVWALPGGGLEPGEEHADALRRELVEEVGLHDPVIGAHIWDREHIIPFEDGLWDGQRDRFYLVEATERFEPRPGLSWEELRAERMHELRWWHVDDVAQHHTVNVLFAPRGLGALLRQLVTDGPPRSPVDTGV